MSAKGRGTKPIANDAYPTPPWVVDRLLERLAVPRFQGGAWLEPAAGTGAIINAVDTYCGANRWAGPNWTAVDIAPRPPLLWADGIRSYTADFVTWAAPSDPLDRFLVAITNPPFSLAFEFAKKMAQVARHSFLLTRLNVLEAGKKSGRLAWLSQNTPDVYVLPDRPCFSHTLECETCGTTAPIAWDAPTPPDWAHHCRYTTEFHRRAGTDATGYCWLHWDAGKLPRSSGIITHLAETPKSERVDRVVER